MLWVRSIGIIVFLFFLNGLFISSGMKNKEYYRNSPMRIYPTDLTPCFGKSDASLLLFLVNARLPPPPAPRFFFPIAKEKNSSIKRKLAKRREQAIFLVLNIFTKGLWSTKGRVQPVRPSFIHFVI